VVNIETGAVLAYRDVKQLLSKPIKEGKIRRKRLSMSNSSVGESNNVSIVTNATTLKKMVLVVTLENPNKGSMWIDCWQKRLWKWHNSIELAVLSYLT
jgi:hypothetical protein